MILKNIMIFCLCLGVVSCKESLPNELLKVETVCDPIVEKVSKMKKKSNYGAPYISYDLYKSLKFDTRKNIFESKKMKLEFEANVDFFNSEIYNLSILILNESNDTSYNRVYDLNLNYPRSNYTKYSSTMLKGYTKIEFNLILDTILINDLGTSKFIFSIEKDDEIELLKSKVKLYDMSFKNGIQEVD